MSTQPILRSRSLKLILRLIRTAYTDAEQNASRAVTQAKSKYPVRPLYFDIQATTPVDPRVLDAMMPYYVHTFGNPHSGTHAYGWESNSAVDNARQKIAELINCDAREIIFTSGATESNNLAIKGTAAFYADQRKNHIITTQIEHKCVLESCKWLEKQGFHVTYLPVKSNGVIDLQSLKDAIRPETFLVTIMTVNNEVGVIQPIAEIGKLCRTHGILFHTDSAQAAGKIPIDVKNMNVDLMSISGHKIYGPKGIGALYVRGSSDVPLQARQSGGGQERGLRSGTVPTALTVGLGKACELAKSEMQHDHEYITKLSQRLIVGLTSRLPQVFLNGDPNLRYPGCVNLSFTDVQGGILLAYLNDIALSAGSACSSVCGKPSHVLTAMGLSDKLAHSAVRFGIGRFTTEEEVDFIVEHIVKQVRSLREDEEEPQHESSAT